MFETVNLSEGIQAVKENGMWTCLVKSEEVNAHVLAEAREACSSMEWCPELRSFKEQSQQLTQKVETREYSGLKVTVTGPTKKKRGQAMALGFIVAAVANEKLHHQCLPQALQPMACEAAALNDRPT